VGDARYAVIARTLVEACRTSDGAIGAPAGADPVLAARGLVTEGDPSDGALPSGRSLLADAALVLSTLTGDAAHRAIAEDAISPAVGIAAEQPRAFGAALAVASRLAAPVEQLVIVGDELAHAATGWRRGVRAVVTPAQVTEFADSGFDLFTGRTRPGAYYCQHFVCALPVFTEADLTSVIEPVEITQQQPTPPQDR